MAELDIFKESPQKWFSFDDDTEILIEHQGKKVLNKISAKAFEIERKTGTPGSAHIVSNKLTGRAAVKGWRKKIDHSHPGLTLGGEPLAFTPANIDMLMTESSDFSYFVNTKCVESNSFRDAVDVSIDSLAADLFDVKETLDDQKNG